MFLDSIEANDQKAQNELDTRYVVVCLQCLCGDVDTDT